MVRTIHSKGSIIFFIVLLFHFAPQDSAFGQSRTWKLTGTVRDSASGQVLPNVNILIAGVSGGTTSLADGSFSLIVKHLPTVLYFSHLGYEIASCQVEKNKTRDIQIFLHKETQEIGGVTISAKRTTKVFQTDSLNIIAYEIYKDHLILLANPYHNSNSSAIYCTSLLGDPVASLLVEKPGKKIKLPLLLVPQTVSLWKDFTGKVNFLDKTGAHEINLQEDKISIGYQTSFTDFIGRVMPICCQMQGRLVFQVATESQNFTLFSGRGAIDGECIKIVNDKKGPNRYLTSLSMYQPHAGFSKKVSAPIFRKGMELYVFDFFDSHFEVFDQNLQAIRKVPISFQNIMINYLLFFNYDDIDQKNFTQTILFDEKAGQAYALFHDRGTSLYSLQQINLENGGIDRVIEIPDYANVSNIQVYNGIVYFLYDSRNYPYYRTLYRMKI